MNSIALFVLCTGLMMAFSLVLYHFLFKKENQNIFFLLLVGIIFGTFFGSLTTFMEVLIDPNEFQIAQDIGFASFNRINTQILWVALAILMATIVFSLKYWHCFDVLALGRENAINLGIDYQKILKVLLILVAILTSVSTALVGPLWICSWLSPQGPYSRRDVNFHHNFGFRAIISDPYFYVPHNIKHHR